MLDRRHVKSFFVLLIFNLLFAFNYLLPPYDEIPGFPYRQDAYTYFLETSYLSKLVREGIAPFATVWFDTVYCGLPQVFTDLPLHGIYLFFWRVTGSLVLSYNLAIFFFYILSSVAMYYLTHILTGNKISSLVSSTAYVFSQHLAFEMLLGHLSMTVAFALIPFIVATYVKSIRDKSLQSTTLCGLLLSVLLIIRPDFGYFTLVFMILLALYFAFTVPNRLQSLIRFVVLFLVAFLFSFPFLNQRFLSQAPRMAESFGIFDYVRYSPELLQFFIPYSKDVNAYLGISVLSLSAIGSLTAFYGFSDKKKTRSKQKKGGEFFLYLLFLGIMFGILGSGANTPLYGLFYQYAPYFSVLRVPTRWLIMTQLCLAILSGKGASVLINAILRKVNVRTILNFSIKKKYLKISLKVLVMLIVLLDLSTYVISTGITVRKPMLGETEGLSVFPPVSSVPEKNGVYEYIKQDAGPYRILCEPLGYSIPYYYYVRDLAETNLTFAYGYGYYPPLNLQRDIYNSIVDGNFTNGIGEKMDLLGVKYLVYNRYLGKQEIVTNLGASENLKLILEDKDYILYRNTRFRDDWTGAFIVKKLYTDVRTLLSKENEVNGSISIIRQDALTLKLEIDVTSPSYVILSKSYDKGWKIHQADVDTNMRIEEYNGLIALFVPQLGNYDLTLRFATYSESLNLLTVFYTLGVILIVAYHVLFRISESFIRAHGYMRRF